MDVIVRKAQQDESHFICDLYKLDKALNDFPNIASDANTEVNDKNRVVWVALLGDVCIGTVALVLDYWQKDLADGKTIGMVKRLRVAKKYQGIGIARLLNNALEREANKLGFDKLSIEVHEVNDHARSVYEHWGYKYFRDGYRKGEIALLRIL